MDSVRFSSEASADTAAAWGPRGRRWETRTWVAGMPHLEQRPSGATQSRECADQPAGRVDHDCGACCHHELHRGRSKGAAILSAPRFEAGPCRSAAGSSGSRRAHAPASQLRGGVGIFAHERRHQSGRASCRLCTPGRRGAENACQQRRQPPGCCGPRRRRGILHCGRGSTGTPRCGPAPDAVGPAVAYRKLLLRPASPRFFLDPFLTSSLS